VYHQFKTKDAIVLAVAEVELSPLQDALDEATSRVEPDRARAVLLRKVIDMAVERRRWVSALHGDPVIIRLLGEHPPFVELMARVYALLMGQEAGPAVAVRTAIVSAAVGGAVVHPLLRDLDDDTLRAELLAVTQRLFDLPD
jgi:AcrR family transcriptional regulator